MLIQTLYITTVNSLSRMEYWSNCSEACNYANWAQIWSNQLWLGIFEIIQNPWRFWRSVNYENCSKLDFLPTRIFPDLSSLPGYFFSSRVIDFRVIEIGKTADMWCPPVSGIVAPCHALVGWRGRRYPDTRLRGYLDAGSRSGCLKPPAPDSPGPRAPPPPPVSCHCTVALLHWRYRLRLRILPLSPQGIVARWTTHEPPSPSSVQRPWVTVALAAARVSRCAAVSSRRAGPRSPLSSSSAGHRSASAPPQVAWAPHHRPCNRHASAPPLSHPKISTFRMWVKFTKF
jgi:hypothetical protein